jgi:hypothetical protein
MAEFEREDTGTTRRDFARNVALLAASSLMSAPETAQAQEAGVKEKPPALAEAWTEMVRAHFGQFLTGDQLKEIKKSMEERQRAVAAMKKIKLHNGDEPAFTFFADLP